MGGRLPHCSAPGIGFTACLLGKSVIFLPQSSSFRCRQVPRCRPVSQRWRMNPESHIKGTEMAQGCHFAFSVQDWSQHPSLQEFGHNRVSQTRPRLRGQKPGVRSGLVHSLAGGSPFRLLTCGQSGGVQLCGVCAVSPAQGNGPLGNQAQMWRKPDILKPQTLSSFVSLACGWMGLESGSWRVTGMAVCRVVPDLHYHRTLYPPPMYVNEDFHREIEHEQGWEV